MLTFSSCLLFWYSWRFFSSSNTFSFKAAWSVHSVVSLRWPCRDLLSFLTHSSVLISPLPLSFLGSLAILFLVCIHPFIANIFLVLLSMLTSSSTVQSTIPALYRSTLTAHALMPLIIFPPFSFDLHSFLTLLTYSDVILSFILVLRVTSNWRMPKYL